MSSGSGRPSPPDRRLPREQSGSEKARLEQAFAEVACERGFGGATVGEVCARASVGEDRFEEHFADLEDCLCEYIERGTMVLLARSVQAFGEQSGWRDALRAVAHTMLRFLQEDPRRARIMLVEVLSAGERARLIRDQGMEALFEFIDLGRQELDRPDSLSRATAEAVGGAIFNRIRSEVEAGDTDSLPELLPKMMYVAVLPYLGPEAAAEELEYPRPRGQ
jgi:AcrR family transcriptional regulator